MLLNEIVKNTDVDHLDRSEVETAYADCVTLVARVNEHVRVAQMKAQLLDIVQKLILPKEYGELQLQAPGIVLKRATVMVQKNFRKQKPFMSSFLKANKTIWDPRRRLCLFMDEAVGPFFVVTMVSQSNVFCNNL